MNVSLVPTVKPLKEHLMEGSGKAKILVMDVSGFISGREKKDGLVEEKTSMISRIKEELRKAGEDRDIAGIVIKLDTPGGTVTASDIIYHEIKEFREQKGVPVYANITGLGTSGGYYVASAADKIYAHPTAITGSIGVITMKFNVKGLMEKIGVSSVAVKSGEKKDIFSPFREDTPEEKKIVQSIIDRLFHRFVDVVAEGRKGALQREKVLALSDGRPYTAGQALNSGLIDKVGYLEDTIEDMKAALGAEEAKVVAYVRPGSYKNNIYSALPGGGGGDINLINIGPDALPALTGVEFLYLWSP
jgi:protease-4